MTESTHPKRDYAGQPPHEKTEENVKIAISLASYGVPTIQIAAALNISEPTLFKYYKDDMTKARAKANGAIGQTLYQKARGGDTTAMIWWTKAQMGWREQPRDIHSLRDDDGYDFANAIRDDDV